MWYVDGGRSTTVEIILYYLTQITCNREHISTTVEIILYYLTCLVVTRSALSTTVEIILYYLTVCPSYTVVYLQQ